MRDSQRAHLSAVRICGRLPGTRQSVLIEATDGGMYVLKAPLLPDAPNLGCNEVLGTELYNCLGLPVPHWKPILITEAFANSNKHLWSDTSEHPGLIPGLGFGTQYLGLGEKRTRQILASSDFSRVENRNHFWLAWMVDICADHCDNRQAVFSESPEDTLYAIFIDHGEMFGGSTGERSCKLVMPRYWNPRIYLRPDRKTLTCFRILSANLASNFDKLKLRVENMPEEWKSASAMKRFQVCLDRLADTSTVRGIFDAILADIDSYWEAKSRMDTVTACQRRRLNLEAASQVASGPNQCVRK